MIQNRYILPGSGLEKNPIPGQSAVLVDKKVNEIILLFLVN